MSTKTAIVILTNIDDDLARVYRALGTVKEYADAGDDVALVFDGSGVDSLAAMTAGDHKLHDMLEGLRSTVVGACSFCVKSHDVVDEVAAGDWKMLDDNDGHASIKALVDEGRQVITF